MEKKTTPENRPMVPIGEVRGSHGYKNRLEKEPPDHWARAGRNVELVSFAKGYFRPSTCPLASET